MVVLSRLLFGGRQTLFQANGLLPKLLAKDATLLQKQAGNIRFMSEHREMPIMSTRWQWHKTKDWIHFYFLVGAIPIALIIFYANVFIGPATLEEIPEGYTPKPWEYYRSPITRFFARYCFREPQEEYEKLLAYTVIQYNKYRIRKLESSIKDYVRDHQDYPIYTFNKSWKAEEIKRARERIDSLGIPRAS